MDPGLALGWRTPAVRRAASPTSLPREDARRLPSKRLSVARPRPHVSCCPPPTATCVFSWHLRSLRLNVAHCTPECRLRLSPASSSSSRPFRHHHCHAAASLPFVSPLPLSHPPRLRPPPTFPRYQADSTSFCLPEFSLGAAVRTCYRCCSRALAPWARASSPLPVSPPLSRRARVESSSPPGRSFRRD